MLPRFSTIAPLLLLLLGGVGGLGCSSEAPTDDAPVRTGAQVLASEHFAALDGKRVGLIVNHTARVDTAHLIDRVARAPNVTLVAIFAPEHGLRGTEGAGEAIENGRDPRTGAPIYSLYGDTRRPTPEMLEGLDALVFDVQDVGARFYTYTVTMGLAMQSAASAGLPFVVLDRPNPLGGDYTSGFVLEPEHESFVGRYPIPIAHGLTAGELARMIRGEAFLPGLDSLALEVVRADGWTRSMQWPGTGLEWRPPSPNLPTWETALLYPGLCFFEGVHASEGRGTSAPFRQIGLPGPASRADSVATLLRAANLPGLSIDTTAFTPRSRPGAPSPRFEGEQLHGIRFRVTEPTAVDPLKTGIYTLHAAYQTVPASANTDFFSRPTHLSRLAGTDGLQTMLENGAPPDSIIARWEDEIAQYRARRSPYLLY